MGLKNMTKQDCNMQDAINEDYDGYYDDVLPTDSGYAKQGIDKELIKRIAGLVVGAIIVISACVAIMYLL